MGSDKIYCKGKNKGLTLIELLVALTILSVIIMITLSALFTVQKTKRSIEKKYDCNAEADRIVQDMENTLRLARQLIVATQNRVLFLDVHADTTEYSQKHDTLYKNGQIMTDLAVDSIVFVYLKCINGEKIDDFYEIDLDNDGIFATYELDGVSGIDVHLWLSSVLKPESSRIKVEKQFSVQLRNLNF